MEGLRRGHHTTPRNNGRPGKRSRTFGWRRRRSNLHRAPRLVDASDRQAQWSATSWSLRARQRHRQGSRGRGTRDDSLHVSPEVERTRRTLEVAQATTLRRKGRLRELQSDIAAAESADREAAAAATKAHHAMVNIGAAALGSTAAPSPSTHQQGVASLSKRPGDDAALNSSPGWGPRSSPRPPLSWRQSGGRRCSRRSSCR